MATARRRRWLGLLAAVVAGVTDLRAQAPLDVVTYNVWHGLRSEAAWRLAREEPERRERRIDWQLVQLRELAPDIVFLQELNPVASLARRYAEALGYDEVHAVANCGIRLGPLHVPRGLAEGQAILARPELRLRLLGRRRLSGSAWCGSGLAIQWSESRVLLLAGVTVRDQDVLLAGFHLHHGPALSEGFDEQLESLVVEDEVTPRQARRATARLAEHRARLMREVERLLAAVDRAREGGPVLLAGDLNARPGSQPWLAIVERGFASASASLHAGGELVTFDPVRNGANYRLGVPADYGLPHFGRPRLVELFDARDRLSRQIDHAFASEAFVPVAAAVVFDRERDGLYGSDHFGLWVRYRLGSRGDPGERR